MHKYIYSFVTVFIFYLLAQPLDTAAQIAPVKTFPIPSDLVGQVNRSSLIGALLYKFDMAAAKGADVLFEHVDPLHRKDLRGYLPLQENDSAGKPTDKFVISFFTNETVPRIAYEVEVSPAAKPVFRSFYTPKKPSTQVANLIRARQTAIDANPSHLQPINPVALPGKLVNEEGVLVYLLAGTKALNVAVFGKHMRVLVESDGSAIKNSAALSNSAIELPIQSKDSGAPKALAVTQLVTDYPTETHVFTSLLTHYPVLVATRRGVWLVNGEKISLIDDKMPGITSH